MAQSIFINLPVESVERARTSYAGLGFDFNEKFNNEKAVCVVVADNILVMLLAKPFFASFTDKPIADAHSSSEVLNCLSCERVDQMVDLAGRHGGNAPMFWNPFMARSLNGSTLDAC